MNPRYISSNEPNNKAERHKYLFELMKHMTTLSSGSVLLLVTFLEKILRDKAPGIFITLAFVGFCISIIFSLGTMLILASNFGGKTSEKNKTDFMVAAMTAIIAFLVGMVFLMSAAYRSY